MTSNYPKTTRLSLIPANKLILQTLLQSDEALARLLSINIAKKWAEFGRAIFQYSLDKIEVEPSEENWWMYLVIYREENRLIGNGGFKGKPDENGCVEIGYSIAPAYRNQGFATEMAQGLIAHAFSFPLVKKVVAHTLAEVNASGAVLQKCGMKRVGELDDLEDEWIWKWELEQLV